MKRSTWFMPIMIIVVCLSCFAAPLAVAAIGAGALGGALAGFGLAFLPGVALVVLAACLVGGSCA